MSAHLVLIDALNLIRRIYAVQERPFANMASDSQSSNSPELSQNTIDQVLNNTQNACTNSLHKILTTLNPTHALAVFDSSEPCWRYDIFPDYKKGRQKMPDHLAKKLTSIQDAFMLQHVDSLIPEQDEADDIIATLADKMSSKGKNVTIISTDKGFLSLLSPHVKVYDYFNRRYLDSNYVEAKFKVQPSQLKDLWTLTGDSTNKIPGVPTIGIKTAAQLLQEHKNIDTLLASTELKSSISDKLIAHKEDIELARSLLTLKTDIPLGFNLKDIRIQAMNSNK
ncbi:MAG: flap endonuclease Xni [Colwellia sp.]